MKPTNYSKLNETQKQRDIEHPSRNGHIFESSTDFEEWMQRIAKKLLFIQETQNKEKNEVN